MTIADENRNGHFQSMSSRRVRIRTVWHQLAIAALVLVLPTAFLTDRTAHSTALQRSAATTRPLALVYRGPISCSGCSEAAASMLKNSPARFRIRYVGPKEKIKLTAAAFVGATVYVQPGGMQEISTANKLLGKSARKAIRNFVKSGGRYLGICMGGYLAGSGPGMGLLAPGNSYQYVGSKGAAAKTTADTVIPITFNGKKRMVFFQDGPYFTATQRKGEKVIARYTNGKIAALVTPYGKGRVGVIGPHPEATRSWYTAAMWKKDKDRADAALGYSLVAALMK